jgi:hypothetical protein
MVKPLNRSFGRQKKSASRRLVIAWIGHLLLLSVSCAGTEDGRKPVCRAGTWKPMDAGVQVDLDGVWGSAEDDVWVTGQNGVILHFDGTQWSLVEHGLANTLDRVSGSNEKDVYAVGWATAGDGPTIESRVYHYDGDSWARVDSGMAGQPRGLWVVGSELLYVVGTDVNRGRIWSFDGTSWQAIANDLETVYSAWSSASGPAYFVGQKRIRELDVRGASLVRLRQGTLEELEFLPNARFQTIFGHDDLIFVAGSDEQDQNLMMMSRDGRSFEAQRLGTEGRIESIFAVSESDAWAVGSGGVAYRWDGQRWLASDTGVAARLRGVYAGDSNHAFAVGESGTILRYDCTPSSPPEPPPRCDWSSIGNVGPELYGMWRVEDRMLLATSAGLFEMQGDVPEVIWTDSEVRFEGVWAAPSGVAFAVGSDATEVPIEALVVRCNSGRCERSETAVRGALFDVHGFSESNVFAVGLDTESDPRCGFVLHYDGSTWTRSELPSCADVRSVWGATTNDVWAVGTVWHDTEQPVGRIFHFDGLEWSVAVESVPVGLVAIDGTDADHVYAVGINEAAPYSGETFGIVMRFDGTSWLTMTTEDSLGYTSVFVDDEMRAWFGVLRWREIEQDTVPEIHSFDGQHFSALTVCDVSAIEDLWIEPSSGYMSAISREGNFLRFDTHSSNTGESTP